MGKELNDKSRLCQVGIGGAFYALISAFIGYLKDAKSFSLCILLFPFFLGVSLVFPPFFMLYILWALEKEGTSKTPLERLKQDLASYLQIFLGYFVSLVLIYYALTSYLSYIFDFYLQESSKIEGLQIATPAQQAYANAFNLGLAVAAFIFYIVLSVTFAAICACAQKEAFFIKTAFKAVFKNLPIILMLGALMVGVMGLIERAFAHFKMQAIEALVLGQTYTDYSLAFLGLRAYVLSSFMVALALVMALCFGVIKNRVVVDANAK